MGAKGKTKTGGRERGTPNVITQDLIKACADQGVDPFIELVKDIQLIDEPGMRAPLWEKVCSYLYPKRKAIEHSADKESGFVIKIMDYSQEKK